MLAPVPPWVVHEVVAAGVGIDQYLATRPQIARTQQTAPGDVQEQVCLGDHLVQLGRLDARRAAIPGANVPASPQGRREPTQLVSEEVEAVAIVFGVGTS